MPSRCVLIADATSIQTLFLAGIFQTNIWLASPPCQPWSKAGTMKGLDTLDGLQFMRLIGAAALMKVKAMLVENVPGFKEHPHHVQILTMLEQIGWRCVISSQDQVVPLLPIFRKRWLGLFMPKHATIDQECIRRASAVVLPSNIPGIGRETSIGSVGCVQHELHSWEKSQAIPDEDAIRIMSTYNLLPSSMQAKLHPTASPEQVLALRVKSTRQIFPNLMALQGVQHELPLSHLREKGLHSFLLEVEGVKRFALPFELSSGMGYPDTLILPKNYKESWHMIGNGLTIAHSMISCYRAHIAMGDQSPFICNWKSVVELCTEIKTNLVDLNEYVVESDQHWMWLRLATLAKATDDDGAHQPSPDLYQPDDIEQPPLKSRCISQTWECAEEEPDHPISKPDLALFPNIGRQIVGTVDLKDASLLTKQQCPLPDSIQKAFQNGTVQHELGDSIATILHDQGIWAMSAWKKNDDTIGTIIRKVLPHAKKECFKTICIGGDETTFSTIPVGVKDCDIIFTPEFFVRVIITQLIPYDLPIRIDVTWKFQDIIAYVASEAAVLTHNLQVFKDGQQMDPQDFALAHDATTFVVRFNEHKLEVGRMVLCQENQPESAQMIQQLKQLDHESARHPTIETMRYTIRDPKWGTLRTITVQDQCSIDEWLKRILPSYSGECQPVVLIDGMAAKPHDLVDVLTCEKHCECHFPGPTKRPNEKIEIVQAFEMEICHEENKSMIWCKGPFDHRAKQVFVENTATVNQILTRMLKEIRCDLTIMPLMGGKLLDPRTLVLQLPPQATIEFRACALPGGAKNEDIATKLQSILKKRGVPEEALQDRVKLIMNKIQLPELRTIIAKDETNMWIEMKQAATKAQLRLITTNELKTHQKNQRQNKTSTASSKSDAPKKFLKPHQVTIDPSIFVAQDEKIQPLEVQFFGPDAKGVSIVQYQEAKRFLPPTRLSADPLALIVLTNQPIGDCQPTPIPAVDGHGTPIVTMAVILNFGDIQVKCKPAVPTTTLIGIETATVEFRIERQWVSKWAEVQNPLNFLGLMLPEIRTEKVISSWAIKFYAKNRDATKHTDAQYAHGYFKIPVAMLEQTLKRSGISGVFLQSKLENRKPDPRFGIVPLHGQTHDEALQLSQKIQGTLGLVIMNDQTFALRGRRENLLEIRKAAFPQSIAAQEGSITPDAKWFILKGLRTSTNCQQLTAALTLTGWETAVAVRPKGHQSWLVCAEKDPPALHVQINEYYTSIIPIGTKINVNAMKSDNTNQAPRAINANFSMCPEEADEAGSTTSTATTRFQEMKVGLEEQISTLVNEKFMQYDAKMQSLQDTMQQQKKDTDEKHNQLQNEVQDIQKSQSAIQNQITDSNQAVVSQMQALFKQMQENMNTKFDNMTTSDGNDPKRIKTHA
eukprot:Skav215072  [mRNA]  locus=scaffold2575:13654:17844:+ [translate_table: standard]